MPYKGPNHASHIYNYTNVQKSYSSELYIPRAPVLGVERNTGCLNVSLVVTYHVAGTAHLYKYLPPVSFPTTVCSKCDIIQGNRQRPAETCCRFIMTDFMSLITCQLVNHTELGRLTDPPATALSHRIRTKNTLSGAFVNKNISSGNPAEGLERVTCTTATADWRTKQDKPPALTPSSKKQARQSAVLRFSPARN